MTTAVAAPAPVSPQSRRSVFADDAPLFLEYRTQLQFRGKIAGGIPKDPKVIEGWLRAKAGVTQDEEVRHMMVRTLIELGAELASDETDMDKIIKASEEMADDVKTNGFKSDENGLYIEGRQVKAALKESANCLWAGDQDWGKTRKGAKNFIAEHVFVKEDSIYLGVTEPTGVSLHIPHIKGKDGTRSALQYVEYVLRPLISLTVQVDALAEAELSKETKKLVSVNTARWSQLWQHMQENGLGAMRGQGYGQFDVVLWERV